MYSKNSIIENNLVVLLLGTNLGDRILWLEKAINALESCLGKVISKSSIYETEAWGNKNQEAYLNMAIVLDTKKIPSECLNTILSIEKNLGRERKERWGARTMDIDIIFYNRMIVQTSDLQIPHPRYMVRNFALIPLAEIIPNYICPELEKSMISLKTNSLDSLEVSKIEIDVFHEI